MFNSAVKSLTQIFAFFCCSGDPPSQSACFYIPPSSSWLTFCLLKPCPQRVVDGLIHLCFLLLYFTLLLSNTAYPKPRKRNFNRHGVGVYFKSVQICCVYLFCINLGILLFWLSDGFWNGWSSTFPIKVVSAGVQSLAWSAMCMETEKTRKERHRHFPCLLRLWWILSLLLSSLTLLSLTVFSTRKWKHHWVEILLHPAVLIVAIAGLKGRTGLKAVPEDEMEEPLLNGAATGSPQNEGNIKLYQNAGFLSLATLSWLNPVLKVGYEKPLELPDIPPLPLEDSTEAMYSVFECNWKALKELKPEETPSISATLWKSFWPVVVVSGMFAVVNVVATYVGPFFVNDLVEYLSGGQRNEREGLALILTFSFAKVVENLAQRQWYFRIQFLCLKVKAALTVVVYRKALRLSNIARISHSSGEIINYMSVDVQRITDFIWYLHQVWIIPLQVTLALGILNRVVGMAWVAALAAACLTFCLNAPLKNLQEKYQGGVMAAKDKRMKAFAECLRSMRVLKLQAWEQRFLGTIEGFRLDEFYWLFKDCIARALVTCLFWSSPILISVATFGMCVLFGIPLTSGRILSAIATFRVLQEAMNSFPELLSFYAQTKVSLDRLWKFLQEEELSADAVIHLAAGRSGDTVVEVEGGEFSWHTSNTEFRTLTGVNFQVKQGSRVAVCGTVGSGKSSLLLSVLGEIPKLAGVVKVSGTTAYVPQSAWIQTGKVEDNIRFGKPMDRSRYESIIDTCSLRKDLELWSFGDQTEIGERGINLSGGQKQRIQLARALYQDSDIYLLDDPFSAVDAHTGSQLFQECILEKLASKTVIYVTHQIEFLPAADNILVLDKGKIVQAGKYEDLLQADTNFQILVNAHNEAINGMEGRGHSPDEEVTTAMRMESDGVEAYCTSSKFSEQSTSNSPITLKQSMKVELGEEAPTQRQLIEEEERKRGSVSLSVYWSYVTGMYKGALAVLAIVCQLGFLLLQVGSNYWMAWAAPARGGDTGKTSGTNLILIFAGLSFGSSLFVVFRALLVSIAGLLVAQKYFLSMIRCIFRAPMSFFDSTPTGRILNRASSDQSELDSTIQYFMGSLMVNATQILGVLGVMSMISWAVPVFIVPILMTCLWMQRYYMTSAREAARVMGIQKSPILNHYGESIAGAATIRGFGQYQRFQETNMQLFDNFMRPAFLQSAMLEWLCFRMELLCSTILAFTLLIMLSRPQNLVDPSLSGLAVTYGLTLNIIIGWFIWNLCNVETKIISVERIQQYTQIQSEAPLLIDLKRPPPSWPSQGTIQLQKLQVRYSPHSPIVLHGITCTFHGGEKIGVVGRTGSGKSTLIQALFRIVEPAGGQIIIDGVDITTIGLHDLRTRLSIIPQDPTLFEGTIRTNLDPLNRHTDIQVWEALDKCQLGDVVRGKDGKLDAVVGENADNWSVGQRQLVCLGRSLLRRTRILVLDEATASVDSATDNVIQRTLRTEFKDCTVVTIAHRIPTVVDSDKVLVLSEGRLAEYNTPAVLLENRGCLFAKLVAEYWIRSTK